MRNGVDPVEGHLAITMLSNRELIAFLGIVAGVSGLAGGLAFAIGAEATFDTPAALPALLVMIWSPNLAAWSVMARRRRVSALLDLARRPGSTASWMIALLPFGVAAWLATTAPSSIELGAGHWVMLVGINLVMGPLGEEVGWRGLLLPALVRRHGALPASLMVGTAWALWHLPLWWLPSPQREIPYPIFFATVLCFSVIMTAVARAGRYALGPAVLFHLGANVGVAYLALSETMGATDAYSRGLPLYAVGAAVSAAWLLSPSPPVVAAATHR